MKVKNKIIICCLFLAMFFLCVSVPAKAEKPQWLTNIGEIEGEVGKQIKVNIKATGGANTELSCAECGLATFFDNGDGTALLSFVPDKEGYFYVSFRAADKDNLDDYIEGSINFKIHPFSPSETSKSNTVTLQLPEGISDLNKLGTTNVSKMVGRLIKTGLGVIGSIALVMFLYGGILWMTSAGNAEGTKKAMDIILWAALGVIVILGSYGLVDFVLQAFQ